MTILGVFGGLCRLRLLGPVHQADLDRDQPYARGMTPALARSMLTRHQFAGTVNTGVCGTTPVSASEKNIIRNVKTRFETKSSSLIQYQVS